MRSFWLLRREVRREAQKTKQPRAVWACSILCQARRRRVQGMSRASVKAELANLQSSIVSAARTAALAVGTGSVNQFLGPTAVGSIAASMVFPSGGRQVTGLASLVSAERKHPQGVIRINPYGGTVHTFAPPAALMPNPSFKRSANGRPPAPGWRYAVHFRHPGAGVLPLSSA